MIPSLTPDQQEALATSEGAPVYLVDEDTLRRYVLIDADTFEVFLSTVFEHDDGQLPGTW